MLGDARGPFGEDAFDPPLASKSPLYAHPQQAQEQQEPVAWRTRSISRINAEKGAWKYWPGPARPLVNSPQDCEFQALYAHPQQAQDNAWNRVEEAVPNSKAKLVWVPDCQCIFAAVFRDGEWSYFGGLGGQIGSGRVTHWRDMPEQPQAQDMGGSEGTATGAAISPEQSTTSSPARPDDLMPCPTCGTIKPRMLLDLPAAQLSVDERAEFEKEISGLPYERSIDRYPNDPTKYAWPGNYKDLAVDLAWCIWRARAALRGGDR